ncbi:MAG: class I SAM-dependent methyltransferase [Firmicutes bacterium]|nr:tRNA (adenine(22)-N(1))-methyltransferase TrmK [Alicyclobacillaceae bacterium]MCL6496606.1 class I SAM-dependent methyltransferase [Bacillota bacterium]
MHRRRSLEPRLALVADWCRPYAVVADIGAGGGQLSRYLADHGHSVIATERSAPGAAVLRQALAGCPSAVVRQGDGFQALRDLGRPFDVAVVAGMGGPTILRIVSEAPWGVPVVVQPMQGWRALRQGLAAAAFRWVKAGLCHQRDRFYPAWMVVRADEGQRFEPLVPREMACHPEYPAWLEREWQRGMRSTRRQKTPSEAVWLEVIGEEVQRWRGKTSLSD